MSENGTCSPTAHVYILPSDQFHICQRGSVLGLPRPTTPPSARTGVASPQQPPSPGGGPGSASRAAQGPASQVKEARRTVLSHDEEVPEWDIASSFNFVTLGIFGGATDPVTAAGKGQQGQDGFWIVSGSLDSSIRSWSVSVDGQVVDETAVPLKTQVMSVCLLNPGVVGCGTPKGGIKVIQPRGEVSYSTLNGHSGPVTGIAKLAGARIATCSEDRTVRVFGTRTGVCESTIEQPQGGVPRCVAALPSGQLVIGCEDGNVRVFTPAESVWTFRGHKGAVLSVAGLDEVRAASGGADGTVRLWRVTQVSEERALTGHNCPVTALAAVNLSRLVSGGEDGALRLWRASDGACLRVLAGHSAAVTGIAVTPEGGRICSSSKDKTCRVWRENGAADEAPVVLEGHTDEVTGVACGMLWESLPPADRHQQKRGCSRLC